MESAVTEKCSSVVIESQEVNSSESAENFQKFIYELFENNGVINDLRAHLRGHIVGVLRSAQTGDPPSCQKNFTQRLELPYQALNILIVEYLLQMEFSYSLSVFVSEIPLANMVFAYAQSMMEANNQDPGLRFKNEDVWSILNYLGIKCDSDHATNIVEMYNRAKMPLLLCILKSMPLYKEPEIRHESSEESVISSERSLEILEQTKMPRQTSHGKCKHYVCCKTCQGKMSRVKEKYKNKKKDLSQNMRDINLNSLSVQSLLKNIDVMERNIIDEMFQQLKTVYEAEVDMMKNDEENRVRNSIATHAVQLKRKRDEMEERYRVRSAELERSVEHKKRFLWGLARTLREQHKHMTRAMHDVRAETARLTAKEDSLKSQLLEAEEILRQRGEDMRNQISKELAILEGHLESMKRERDSINKERSELDHVKNLCNNTKNYHNENEELKSHYDLLKNEFLILRKYLEKVKLEPKCVIERSTMPELGDVTSKIDLVLNNGHDMERRSDEKLKPSQVVNNLKKQKNVNFDQSNLDELYRSRSQSSRSRSSASSEGGDPAPPAPPAPHLAHIQRLRDDNERLADFARQQGQKIEELTSGQARLQAELALRPPRPRTAPAVFPHSNFMQRVNATASTSNFSHGWRKGAGEELSFLANAQPRIVVPGDNIPFIGVIRDRHSDNRRYLINQWRSLRRVSPISGSRRSARAQSLYLTSFPTSTGAVPGVSITVEETLNNNVDNLDVEFNDDAFHMPREQYQQRPKTAVTGSNAREKSPKSVLREAKEKLKSNEYNARDQPSITREKSPNTVLREAKLRLKKLEIEAEAVEKSYQDFRKKQEALKSGRSLVINDAVNEFDLKRIRSSHRSDARESTSNGSKEPKTSTPYNFDKYVQDYAKFDIGQTHFKNKNAICSQVNPIPTAYTTEMANKEKKQNYLETPLSEFRKFYNSDKRLRDESTSDLKRSMSDERNIDDKEINNRPDSPIQMNVEKSEINNVPQKPILTSEENSGRNDPDKSLLLKKLHSENSRPNTPIPKNTGHSECKTLLTPTVKKNLEGPDNSTRKEETIAKKKKELDILESNIKKIYNLPEKSDLANDTSEELKIDRNPHVSNETTSVVTHETNSESRDVRNLLRIEVESVSQVNDVKITESQSQDLFFIVESSIDNRDSTISDESDKEKSAQMTIIVTPKRSNVRKSDNSPSLKSDKSKCESDEAAAKISGNDVLNNIYHASPDQISSIQMHLELSKDAFDNTALSELEQNEELDYPDDFSADVDNYNSRSVDLSPVSLIKTSEDENFWDN